MPSLSEVILHASKIIMLQVRDLYSAEIHVIVIPWPTEELKGQMRECNICSYL